MSRSGWATETRSRHERGYGNAWDKLRLVILERDKYLCQCDQCLGGRKRLRPANEVNHIVSKAEASRKGWTQEQIDDPSNLQSVNSECHDRISLEQRGAKPRPHIGLDGWPT